MRTEVALAVLLTACATARPPPQVVAFHDGMTSPSCDRAMLATALRPFAAEYPDEYWISCVVDADARLSACRRIKGSSEGARWILPALDGLRCQSAARDGERAVAVRYVFRLRLRSGETPAGDAP